MFVLEVSFKAPPISREVVFVKRPSTLLGASEESNVTLDELAELGCDLRITRQLGRTFKVAPEGEVSKSARFEGAINGLFDKETEINLEKVSVRIIAIDSDLLMREEETPDRAGVRILRQAFSRASPRFPALNVEQPGNPSFCVSFAEGSALLIGRGSDCAVRIDAPEISSHHARIGFESSSFWVEDLGSTNGTFIANKQISSKTPLATGQSVRLAQNVYLTGQSHPEHHQNINKGQQNIPDSNFPESPLSIAKVIESETNQAQVRFPCLVSVSELCRPARVALKPGVTVQIGREQGCDIWLGAPHVSRLHAEVTLEADGKVTFADISTNGTQFDGGFLKKGDILTLQQEPRVFDFGEGITLAVCFEESQEERYRTSSGALTIFRRKMALRQHAKAGATEGITVSASIAQPRKRHGQFGRSGSSLVTDWKQNFKLVLSALGVLGTVLVLISITLILAILFMLWSAI